MEKLIYALWAGDGGRDALNAALRSDLATALKPHVKSLRINIQDDAVEGGNSPRFAIADPQMDAFVQVWVDSAYNSRAAIEAALNDAAGRVEGWLVAESAVLPNETHSSQPGERTPGFSQMVCLTKPDHLEYDQWRSNWQDGHSKCAVETQSNFEYIQNLVVRPLTDGMTQITAIVEECFPAGALHDKGIFYDAQDDPAKLAANEAAMMDSCANFMGPEGCECIPTSQYDMI